MAKMKVAQVPKAGGEFEIVEREIPQPGAGHVRIKVQACGVWRRRECVEERAARWRGLAWRAGRNVFAVSARGFWKLREFESFRNQL